MSAPFVPTPLFGCACPDCATEASYPADMLRWLPNRDGLICQECWDAWPRCRYEFGAEEAGDDEPLTWGSLSRFRFTFEVLS